MSKHAWYVMMAVIIILGVIVGFLYLAPFAPWRSTSTREIPLAFSGEKREVLFVEVSQEEFQRLSFDTTYYQIFFDTNTSLTVKAWGIKEDVIYQTEKRYMEPYGFDYDHIYSDNILTLPMTFNLLSYFVGTMLVLILVGIVCTIIGLLTYNFVVEVY